MLVFANPFDLPDKNYECKMFSEPLEASVAANKFAKYFRISEEEGIFQEFVD